MRFEYSRCHWSESPCFAFGVAINAGKRLGGFVPGPGWTGFSIHIGLFFFRFGVAIGHEVRSTYQPFKFLKLEKL